MSIWTSERLNTRGRHLIQPFDRRQVKSCAYELRLGAEAYVTGRELGRKESLALNGRDAQVVIPPGQFALLLTEETVEIPNDAMGLISIKTSFKLHGLVNVSGFHADPGFKGKLVFSVYNAGGSEIVVSRGEPLFLLWFLSLEDSTEDVYKGVHQGQVQLENSDIMVIGQEQFSPASLNDRLTEVEVRLQILLGIAIALGVGIILAIARWAIPLLLKGN